MARLNVNPTRMELTRLKRLLNTTKRGHKLLKDKQDEMIRHYMSLVKENRTLRKEVETELDQIIGKFQEAVSLNGEATIKEALLIPSRLLELKPAKKSIMNIDVPSLEFSSDGSTLPTYGFAFTSVSLDEPVKRCANLLEKLVRLAEIEKTCEMLSSEIEKTRRRVNAIEFVMIPNYEETIHFINMKLDDNERSNTIRLMKSKEVILKKQQS